MIYLNLQKCSSPYTYRHHILWNCIFLRLTHILEFILLCWALLPLLYLYTLFWSLLTKLYIVWWCIILLIDSFIYFYFLFSRVKVERQSGVDYRSLEWHRGGVVLSARGTRCSASAVCPQGEWAGEGKAHMFRYEQSWETFERQE